MLHDKIKRYGVRIIIICLSMLFLSTFVAKKEGFHVDEVLSFQVGNSEFTPWIMPAQPVGRLAKFVGEHIEGDSFGETIENIVFIAKDTLANRENSIVAAYKADVYEAPVWILAEHFKDYLECDSEDAFNLLSVYYNAKDDIHPPLYYIAVHFVCSIFQGEITVWHGCVINMVALAVTLWLLGCIGDMLFKRRSSTVALMLLYAFSSGIIATALWVRMYALLTLWLIWLLYLHIRKMTQYKQDSFARVNSKTGRSRWIGSFGILIATLVTFWTNYFGLFFLLPLAACTFLLLLKEKRTKECWAYVRTMVTAAVIGLGLFPFAISDVFSSAFGTEVLSQLEDGISDYVTRLLKFGDILAKNVAGGAVFFLLALIVPLLFGLYGRIKNGEKAAGNKWALLLCVVPTVVFFLLDAKMSPHFVERYFMPVFPLAALLIVLAWEWGFLRILQEKWYDMVCIALACLLLIVQMPEREWQEDYFRTGYKDQFAIAEQYREYPMVCLYAGYSLYENIFEMQKYKQSILVQEHELSMLGASHREPAKNGYVAVIKYPHEDDNGMEQLEKIMNAFGGGQVEFLGRGKAYGDALYLVKPWSEGAPTRARD